MRHTLVLAITTILFFGISSCSKNKAPVAAVDTSYQTSTIQYNNSITINTNLVSLDVYGLLPVSSLRPVIIWVHGGAWAIGDKSNSLSNKLSLFNQLQYVFVSVNYRLSPAIVSTDPNRIKFPTHNNDVADAVKWVIDNIASYGGDNNKIVLLGHSAGAHLVSLTGSSQQFLPARGIALNKIKGIASIDTEGYDVPSQSGEVIYQNAFGTDYTIQMQASPIYNLAAGNSYPKFFVAKRGSASRIAFANNFITKLQSVGVQVSQVDGSQYDHEGINDAIGNPNDTVITPALKLFLTSCFL